MTPILCIPIWQAMLLAAIPLAALTLPAIAQR